VGNGVARRPLDEVALRIRLPVGYAADGVGVLPLNMNIPLFYKMIEHFNTRAYEKGDSYMTLASKFGPFFTLLQMSRDPKLVRYEEQQPLELSTSNWLKLANEEAVKIKSHMGKLLKETFVEMKNILSEEHPAPVPVMRDYRNLHNFGTAVYTFSNNVNLGETPRSLELAVRAMARSVHYLHQDEFVLMFCAYIAGLVSDFRPVGGFASALPWYRKALSTLSSEISCVTVIESLLTSLTRVPRFKAVNMDLVTVEVALRLLDAGSDPQLTAIKAGLLAMEPDPNRTESMSRLLMERVQDLSLAAQGTMRVLGCVRRLLGANLPKDLASALLRAKDTSSSLVQNLSEGTNLQVVFDVLRAHVELETGAAAVVAPKPLFPAEPTPLLPASTLQRGVERFRQYVGSGQFAEPMPPVQAYLRLSMMLGPALSSAIRNPSVDSLTDSLLRDFKGLRSFVRDQSALLLEALGEIARLRANTLAVDVAIPLESVRTFGTGALGFGELQEAGAVSTTGDSEDEVRLYTRQMLTSLKAGYLVPVVRELLTETVVWHKVVCEPIVRLIPKSLLLVAMGGTPDNLADPIVELESDLATAPILVPAYYAFEMQSRALGPAFFAEVAASVDPPPLMRSLIPLARSRLRDGM
jgi:hypothetical protein